MTHISEEGFAGALKYIFWSLFESPELFSETVIPRLQTENGNSLEVNLNFHAGWSLPPPSPTSQCSLFQLVTGQDDHGKTFRILLSHSMMYTKILCGQYRKCYAYLKIAFKSFTYLTARPILDWFVTAKSFFDIVNVLAFSVVMQSA